MALFRPCEQSRKQGLGLSFTRVRVVRRFLLVTLLILRFLLSLQQNISNASVNSNILHFRSHRNICCIIAQVTTEALCPHHRHQRISAQSRHPEPTRRRSRCLVGGNLPEDIHERPKSSDRHSLQSLCYSQEYQGPSRGACHEFLYSSRRSHPHFLRWTWRRGKPSERLAVWWRLKSQDPDALSVRLHPID